MNPDQTHTPIPEPANLTPAPWRKAIPIARDRLQSRLLVNILGPLLAILAALACNRLGRAAALPALVVSVFFALLTWRIKAATAPAALCGGIVCLLLTLCPGPSHDPLHSTLAPLVLLFLLTFAVTRAGHSRKQRAGLAESHRGRSASQVLANLGASALAATGLAAPLFHLNPTATPVLVLAALAEATADTVSSEIGQAFGGRPILITILRRVAPGTDGAITLLGTTAGIAAAVAVVILTANPALGLSVTAIAFALIAAILGLFFDSLLGATIERRGWLGNDLVNFTSTLFAVLCAAILLRLVPAR